MDIQVNHINNKITDKGTFTFTQAKGPYSIPSYKGIGNNAINSSQLQVRTFITYQTSESVTINAVVFTPATPFFKKLQYIDYRFDFQNADVVNYNTSKEDIKANITESNQLTNMVALYDNNIKSESIDKIQFYYNNSPTVNNDILVFNNNSFSNTFFQRQTPTSFIINPNWTVKPDYFLYQIVTINPKITNGESYMNGNTCTVKSSYNFYDHYIKSQANSI